MSAPSGSILLCTPEAPEPLRQSGSRRLYHFVELLLELGCRVSVLCQYSSTADRERLQQLGVPVYREQDLNELLMATEHDVAVIAFWELAESYLPALRSLSPGTAVIVDSIDLHFLRGARQAFGSKANGGAPSLGSEYGSAMVRELNTYAEADLVLTVSEKEAATLNDLLNEPARAMPVPDAEDLAMGSEPFDERDLILFIGNFRHPPNEEALDYLCSEIVPRLDPEVLQACSVAVVGNALAGEAWDLCERTPGVKPVGFVPEVAPYLGRSRVFVAPLLHGAGTKRKLIQALLVGTPAVATRIAAEGLEAEDGEGVIIADEPEEFAAAINRLALDERHWSRIAQRGREPILRPHGRKAVRTELTRALEQALGRATTRNGRRSRSAATAAVATSPPAESPPDIELGTMKREWDTRAKSNAMHYIASGQEEWDEAEFFESGRKSVEKLITPDVELICGQRDPARMRMLEIGCGIGRMTRHLAEIFQEVHGVDVSGEMIRQGREKLADVENAFLVETNGSDLRQFAPGFFDFAFSFIVFQHIPSKEVIVSYLREVHRTLRPGCLFKFQVQGKEVARPDTWLGAGFNADELESIAAEIGFTPVQCRGAGTQYFWNWWRRTEALGGAG